MNAARKRIVLAAIATLAFAGVRASAQAVLPGYLTDSTAKPEAAGKGERYATPDRKSTRLNSSHQV